MTGGLRRYTLPAPMRSFFWLFVGIVIGAQPLHATGANETAMRHKTIDAVLSQHTPSLMSLPGVVGTAQSECDGTPCIKVYVSKKRPDLLRQIPSQIDGFPVVVEETGEIRARDPN